jgi:predicted alpha/beta-hydrolase family hydrolase
MTDVATRLSAAGVSVVTFEFPYMQAGRRAPDRGPVLDAAFAEAWGTALARYGSANQRVFAGGKSMGGRIATQATAAGLLTPMPSGLVSFGYPLHPPAKPTVRRDKHLSRVACPILFVHGTRDPFGSPDEMRELHRALPHSTLILAPDGDHSLDAPKRSDPEGTTRHAAVVLAAGWMKGSGTTGATGTTGDR